MAYIDPQHNVTVQQTVLGGGPSVGASLGTAAGTGTVTVTYTGTAGKQVNGTLQFPVFKNPLLLVGIRVYTVTAPGVGVSGVILGFMNGTSTIGTCSVASAGTYVDVTLLGTETYNTHGIGAGAVLFTNTGSNEVTMLNTATQTATASSLGTYAVDFLWRTAFIQ